MNGPQNGRCTATIYSFGATLRLLEYKEVMESTTSQAELLFFVFFGLMLLEVTRIVIAACRRRHK